MSARFPVVLNMLGFLSEQAKNISTTLELLVSGRSRDDVPVTQSVHLMKHGRGIDLARLDGVTAITPVAVEIAGRCLSRRSWTKPFGDGGVLLETISSSSDFQVSVAAFAAALRQRPGKYLVHVNGPSPMRSELAPDPPRPERDRSQMRARPEPDQTR